MSVELEGGVRLSCREVACRREDAGGRTTLLIHGLNANIAFWRQPLVTRLASASRVLMYDQRGHGYSDMSSTGYTTFSLAGDAHEVMQAHGAERVDVVAHSFGAGIALQLARRWPERVASLVILDGRVRSLQPELKLRHWTEFERWHAHFAAAGIELDPDMDVDFRLPLLVDGELWERVRPGLEAEGFFVPRGGKRMRAKHRRLLEETSAAVDYVDIAGLTPAAIERIQTPTLAIYGSISAYLPTLEGLRRHLPRCRWEHMPDAGHNFPFLHAEETADRVLSFWESSSRADRRVDAT